MIGKYLKRPWLLVLVLGVATGVGFLLGSRPGASPPELAREQWRRLTRRWVQQFASGRNGPAGPRAEPRNELASAEEGRDVVPGRLPLDPLSPEELARQLEDYSAPRPKTVIELQPHRVDRSVEIRGDDGRTGVATLINLNPTVNAWYLLRLQWAGAELQDYHLVNAHPETQDLSLDPDYPYGLKISDSSRAVPCDLWSSESPLRIEEAATFRSPYVSLCNDEVTLRLRTAGRRTTKEWATDFLRDYVWGGEKITVFVRRTFFQDAYLHTSEAEPGVPVVLESERRDAACPSPARIDSKYQGSVLEPVGLGIEPDVSTAEGLRVGQWHRTRHHSGVSVSIVQPEVVASEILRSHPGIVSPLDEVERKALVYLIAFDLDRFELGFALGTDHPRVDWSERVPPSVVEPSLPGPDGIGSIDPLVATGIIPPAAAPRTAATFVGGFKRSHGAFKYSELAYRNNGTHYGFIESGVILSKLQPGLATILVMEDRQVEMKTWAREDDGLLGDVRFARQNGVPIIEPDPETGSPVPGRLVARWAEGNWSGSQDRKFRTARAGVCLQECGDRRFLIYGYFSSATPSAMARVFEAYGCRYAMLLDMNALEHTYLALYHVKDSGLVVEHLIDEMRVLDKEIDGEVLPRFLGFADNRDFFYLLRRERGGAGTSPSSGPVGPSVTKLPGEDGRP